MSIVRTTLAHFCVEIPLTPIIILPEKKLTQFFQNGRLLNAYVNDLRHFSESRSSSGSTLSVRLSATLGVPSLCNL